MAFKTTKHGRAYCAVGVRIPENTLTRASFDALNNAVDRIGNKDLKVLGMEPGKPVFGGPSETLPMSVLVGKIIGSVAMDSTKRLSLGPSRKALDQYRSDGSLLHQLRDEVSEELGALLFEETAHFYCVGSFFKLVLGTMWHTNIIMGVDLDEEFNNLWPGTYGLEKIHPNLNRGFWDDTSRLFGVVMAKASSKGHWSRATSDLEQAQARIVAAREKGFTWAEFHAHLYLCETTWRDH